MELIDVPWRDLIEIDVAPAGVVLVDRDPVVGFRARSIRFRYLSPAADRAYSEYRRAD